MPYVNKINLLHRLDLSTSTLIYFDIAHNRLINLQFHRAFFLIIQTKHQTHHLIVYILCAVYFGTCAGLRATEQFNIPPSMPYQDIMINGNLGPKMITLPAGSFRMGDIQGIGKSYEQPVHLVTISVPFAISQFPITFSEYDTFSKATGRKLVDQYKWPRGLHPVINVNWEDAKDYAHWLSKETNKTYRLPSESEWEYAARAGSTEKYPWGDQIGINNAHCTSCGDTPIKNQTAPVGSYPANHWGIHDMIGNVWEMTGDCWNYNYIIAPKDGAAWIDGDCTRLVLRGGSWGDTPNDLRSSTRLRSYSKARTVNIGFRLVREE